MQGESSATSAPDMTEALPYRSPKKKKRRQSHRRRILNKSFREPPPTEQQRYWNEFDDGSEGSENEAYTIFVDPNASSSLPGAAVISSMLNSIRSAIAAAEHKVNSWLRPSRDQKTNEHGPLLNGDDSHSIEDSDESDDESSPRYFKGVASRHYSTFPAPFQPPAVRAREILLLRSSLASFGASVILLVVATILKTTGRRKAETTVDAGVIIGVAAALVFAIIAVGSMFGRKDDVGWIHRAIVLLMFLCIVAGSGTLLASLG